MPLIYSINISDKFKSEDSIRKGLKNIYQFMKRYIKNNNNFSNISFVIGISNVNSNSAKVTYNHNKLRGRPRKMITGENVEWHFHIYVIGNEFSSASYFSTLVKDILILKRKYRVSISTNDNIDNALNYVNKQCISYWKYGQYFNSKNSYRESHIK